MKGHDLKIYLFTDPGTLGRNSSVRGSYEGSFLRSAGVLPTSPGELSFSFSLAILSLSSDLLLSYCLFSVSISARMSFLNISQFSKGSVNQCVTALLQAELYQNFLLLNLLSLNRSSGRLSQFFRLQVVPFSHHSLYLYERKLAVLLP